MMSGLSGLVAMVPPAPEPQLVKQRPEVGSQIDGALHVQVCCWPQLS
jgi:hypothetical protein